MEEDSDIETGLGHVSKNDYNAPELFNNDGLGLKNVENTKKIFTKKNKDKDAPIQKINDETYKTEKWDKDGKP